MSLDGYDVIRELGRGGMAVVHLARQRDLGRLAALKELAGLNADDPSFAERFLRESRVAGSLNHANIVTVYEYFDDGGTPFIAMELMEGGSLRPLIGELSLPKVARVLEDLLAAIGHAAKAGIVHRDLKPENALLTKAGRIKVADFGIAKAALSGQKGLTSEGMTVGTPEYMSPEQAMAKDVSTTSDLYSIGCMTYEMLTGRLPFNEGSQAALLMKQVSEPVPDVRDVDPLIPEAVALWVARMTEKDPDDRFQEAGEAWEAFEEAVLEFVGPLWRRDATIEPASEIELDDIPPQTATPLRPASRKERGATGGSVTGFQTYHAPAALHEQLSAEGADVAPSVLTPPPAPATRPAPRRVTPAPQPVAATTVGAPATAERPPADDEQPVGGLRAGPIAAAAAVAAIIAFVVGIASGGGASLASASGDGFVLKAPADWSTDGAVADDALGATVTALAPAGAGATDSVSAARVPAAEAAAVVRRNGGAVSIVTLSAGEAIRYGDSLYVLPTDAGSLLVACASGAAARAACGDIAGSLELTRGTARPSGPSDEGAAAIGAALSTLRTAVRNPTADLAAATTARAQGVAAGDLARAYRDAARAVGGAPAGV
ncbi:MAG: serine/threonine-protein kinase, partial [Solirubrobacteraceae bacterium]|nr:serine/threonine-protein kinase [Solirubrobacteraceae bacterium]